MTVEKRENGKYVLSGVMPQWVRKMIWDIQAAAGKDSSESFSSLLRKLAACETREREVESAKYRAEQKSKLCKLRNDIMWWEAKYLREFDWAEEYCDELKVGKDNDKYYLFDLCGKPIILEEKGEAVESFDNVKFSAAEGVTFDELRKTSKNNGEFGADEHIRGFRADVEFGILEVEHKGKVHELRVLYNYYRGLRVLPVVRYYLNAIIR